MGKIIEVIVDIIEVIVDVVVVVVEFIWDEIAVPTLEWIFSLVGIVDETAVTSQRVSVAVFDNHSEDLVKAAITRAVITKVKTGTLFLPNYMREIYRVKGEVKAYYNYADNGSYVHGLPEMVVAGVRRSSEDSSIIENAIASYSGGPSTLISTVSGFSDATKHFKFLLQRSHNYLPYNNTLTHLDPHGTLRSDWILVSPPVFNVSTLDYTLNVYRNAEGARFWIEGPSMVTESDTAVFTVRSSKAVPLGVTAITINLSYSGTAVDGTNYTEVASVLMPSSTDEVDISVATVDLPAGQPSTTFTIRIDSIPNTGSPFEHVIIGTPSSVTCTIASDDALVLTMKDHLVPERGNAIVPVKLEQSASGAFTVDYTFTDVDTVGGVDYDNTTGTLNFAGTEGEVQNIVIPITGDVINDDNEKFLVGLTNCSDPAVDISRYATITIEDDTDTHVTALSYVASTIRGANYTPERHLVAKYHLTASPSSEWFFWLYRYADNTLDIRDSSQSFSKLDMLPVAVLRKAGVFCDVNKALPIYTSTKRLMSRLSLDIDDFITNISSRPDEQLAEISDAYVNFSMAPYNTHKVVSKLLYLSFYDMIVNNGLYSETNEYSAVFTEGDINNSVVWTEHTYTHGVSEVATEEGDYIHSVDFTSTSTANEDPRDPNAIATGSILHLKHQVTATTCNHIMVHNLNIMTSVRYNRYHKVAFSKLWDETTNAVNKNFTIPISWAVFKQLDGKEQISVYQYICRLDLYALSVQELEFYETEGFWRLFADVSKVLSIVSLGQSLVAGTLLRTLAVQLLTRYAIGELVAFVAEDTGNARLAAVAGLVASVVADGNFDLTLVEPEKLTELATEFANNYVNSSVTIHNNSMEAMLEKGLSEQEALDELEEKRLNSPITAEFLNSLKSLEAQVVTAIDSQYQFDATFGYGMVENYHSANLRTGII